ncbi:hypothetical protein NDU88_002729 [Pleurodeles waltl]|uniref:Uncharacterized protein n=1 Tax=Pleurodeles waltl TaxID=8319 RepID=A0AAV7W414_PLEWA|nr:hypothetical protein NDU88_002729 [Pleurodeles waltl]
MCAYTHVELGIQATETQPSWGRRSFAREARARSQEDDAFLPLGRGPSPRQRPGSRPRSRDVCLAAPPDSGGGFIGLTPSSVSQHPLSCFSRAFSARSSGRAAAVRPSRAGLDHPPTIFTDPECRVSAQVLWRERPLRGDTAFSCSALGSSRSRDFNELGHSAAPGTRRSGASSSGAPDPCVGPRPAVPIARADLLNAFHRRHAPSGILRHSADRARRHGPRPPCQPQGRLSY